MGYRAELFDRFNYLYEETGYTDHQIHCVIDFDDRININLMERAFRLLLKVIPILSCAYRTNDGRTYWKKVNPFDLTELFTVAQDLDSFITFTTSRTCELTGPQIKACLYQEDKASLSIVINHMICDAAGFKQCLYVLSDLYSALVENPDYEPDYQIDGDRSIRSITSAFTKLDKAKVLLRNKENKKSTDQIPISNNPVTAPFLITRQILENRYLKINEYCKHNEVTFNDVLLTAYVRVLARHLNTYGRPLRIPIMVDMRRYLKDKSFHALTNLSSTEAIIITVNHGETFEETLSKVNYEMTRKKSDNIGLNAFTILEFVSKVFNEKGSYQVIKLGIKNPLITTTNIGIIDDQKLVFQGATVNNAFICASLKYRPYFQMAASSFRNKLTISSGLYGSREDRETISDILEDLVKEMPN